MELCCCLSTISNPNSNNLHSSFKPCQISRTLGRRRNGRLSLESSVERTLSPANLLSIASRARSATQLCDAAPGDRVRPWREAVRMNGAVVWWRGNENRRVLGLRVKASGGGDTMWVTATAAVALVLSLAAFAAIGGFLLSKGLDNQIREEEEEIEELKAKGLYSEPKVTQYEEQGVGTTKRNRRVSEE